MGLFSFGAKRSEGGDAKVVAILNQKGGVGKTTLAFNTARALGERGHRVLAIDMDPQGNLTGLLGQAVSDERSIFQLLVNSLKELKPLHRPVVLGEFLMQAGHGVDGIGSTQILSGLELTVAGIRFPKQLILKQFLNRSGLLDMYDYVVIDGPPTLGLLMVNIVCACHGVLVPFRPDHFSEAGLQHFHGVIEDVEDMGIVDAPKIIGHIPNLVESRRKQTQQDLERIVGKLHGRILPQFYNRAAIEKCSSQRKSVFDFQTKEFSELQADFHTIGEAIEQELSQ